MRTTLLVWMLLGMNAGGLGATGEAPGILCVAPGMFGSLTATFSGPAIGTGMNVCGVAVWNDTHFLAMRACGDGLFVIDTVGSAVDTVLAVYRATNLFNLPSALVVCDDDGAPDGIRSRVQFPARNGELFIVTIDHKADLGIVKLNWVLATFQLKIAAGHTNSEFQVRLTGPIGHAQVVEATSDLAIWRPIHTNESSATPLDIVDAPVGFVPSRFYRARPWP